MQQTWPTAESPADAQDADHAFESSLTMEVLDVGHAADDAPWRPPAKPAHPGLRVAAVAIVVTVLIAAGVFLLVSPGDEPESASSAPAPADLAAEGVPQTLRFTGKTLAGDTYDAAQLAGKPTVLWFWAPWCATCASQASSVADAAREYKGEVNFLGVAGLDNSTTAMRQFVKDLDVGNVRHLDDQAGVVWRKFAIKEQSTYVMLDSSGKVIQNGWLDDATFAEWLEHMTA